MHLLLFILVFVFVIIVFILAMFRRVLSFIFGGFRGHGNRGGFSNSRGNEGQGYDSSSRTDNNNSSSKVFSKNEGEYVNYEEVD